LIRIAECALTLHCEVNADDDAAARHQVKQIPNLMAWRQISSEELAEITGKRDGSIKVRSGTGGSADSYHGDLA
jgi:hypothetical protein